MWALVLFSVLALLSLPGQVLAKQCQTHPYPIVFPEGYQHDRWVKGQGPGDILVKFDGFTGVFDGPDDDDNDPTTINILAVPQWVSHEVHRYAQNGIFVYAEGFERPSHWYEIEQTAFVGDQPGVTNKKIDASYAGEAEVWNRGHMATRNLVNRISSEAGCNTHNFANAVPQFWSLNQGEWLALENYTGAIANKYSAAWAISGPIFYRGQPIETIGGDGEIKIAVPHALFKVIVFKVNEDINTRAFLFHQPTYRKVKAVMAANGNKPPLLGFRLCGGTKQEDYDFAGFASSLSEIESLTDITFFPAATASEKSALNSQSSRRIWRIDMKYFEKPCGDDG